MLVINAISILKLRSEIWSHRDIRYKTISGHKHTRSTRICFMTLAYLIHIKGENKYF